MSWPLMLSCSLVAAAHVVAGGVLLRARLAVPTGALLVGAGLTGLLSVWLLGREHPSLVAAPLLILAGMVLLPAALWAYPVPRWRGAVDFTLAVCLVGPGLVAALSSQDVGVVATMGLVAALALLMQTWWRLEQDAAGQRRALLWMGLATASAALTGVLAVFLLAEPWGRTLGVAPLVLVPLAMVVGVARPEVIDVRGLVVQVVVLGLVGAAYLAYFVGAVSTFEVLGGEPASPAVTAALGLVGALAWHPTAVVLRGVIDRLLFGDRPDPLRAARTAAGRMGDDPALALEAVCDALVLPYAEVRADGVALVSAGVEVTQCRSLPLALAGGAPGELVVGLRAGDLRLSAQDEQVLRLLAPLLAQTLRVRALALDLQVSRSQVVTGVAEERRRLRRDLHDGLGPTLSGMAFSVDAARNALRTDPEVTDRLLLDLRADASDTVTEIRRIVEGLRPPSLDEFGLVRALRQRSTVLRRADGTLVTVHVAAPQALPPLPAAVEVAAYRIVVEALTNVARHSTGARAWVRIGVSGPSLLLEVSDDGTSAAAWRPGVGLTSMLERVEEVGGTLVWSDEGQPSRVTAVLPLPSPSPE